MPSDWTKARDEAKAQAARALFSALLGWFRRKLARKAPEPAERLVRVDTTCPKCGFEDYTHVNARIPGDLIATCSGCGFQRTVWSSPR